jgi:hypothetical protein
MMKKKYYRVTTFSAGSYWYNEKKRKWVKNPDFKGAWLSDAHFSSEEKAFKSGEQLRDLGAVVTIEECQGRKLLRVWDSERVKGQDYEGDDNGN